MERDSCTHEGPSATESHRSLSLLHKYPTLAFFGLSYVAVWLLWFAVRSLAGAGDPFAFPWILLWALGSWIPNTVALCIVGLIAGRSAVIDLLKGFTRWRVSGRWYIAAVALPFAVAFTSARLYRLAGYEAPHIETSFSIPALTLGVLSNLILGPTGEEIGWRGFALPRLQARFNALSASLMLGLVWAGFHLPLWFVPGAPQQSSPFWAFTIGVVAWSILLTLIYNHSKGSLIPVILCHLCVNLSWQLVTDQLGLIPRGSYWMISTGLYCLIAIVVVIWAGPERWHQNPPGS